MQLLTDWDGFLAEVGARWPQGTRVYLAREGRFTVLTATDPDAKTVFCCRHAAPLEEARSQLESQGHTCFEGVWTTDSDYRSLDEVYIAAVAYLSDEKQPGLWVDVTTDQPTPSAVMAKLLAEFHADGTLPDKDHDTFHKRARPNILILTPDQIQRFLAANQTNTFEPESE